LQALTNSRNNKKLSVDVVLVWGDSVSNYKEVSERLRGRWESILNTYSPGGKVVGREYTAGQINGGEGDSFKFNMQTGKWAEFNGGDKGNDIVSYYAAVKGISNSEAKSELMNKYLNEPVKHTYPVQLDYTAKIIKPPPNVSDPGEVPKSGILPSNKWVYKDADGGTLFYVYRYDMPDGKKEFKPMSFTDTGKWIPKMASGLRPLYNLDKLVANPTKPVMVVEGEKTAVAAESIAGNTYTITTWPGGASAVTKADVSPLKGRKLVLWPDADEPGIKAMQFLASKLLVDTEEIKVIRPDVNSGWDAADALAEGWDWSKFKDWAKRPGILEPLTKPIKHVKAELMDAEGDNHSQQLVGEISDVPSIMAQQLGLKTKEIAKQVYIIPNASNAKIVLSEHPQFKGKFWFDDFYKKGFTNYFGKQEPLEDDLIKKLWVLFQHKYGFETMAKPNFFDAMDVACLEDIRNEPLTWLESLKWDGEKRVEEFFVRAYGTEDNEYTRKVSQNFFVAQVARINQPGCKFDNMVILEGIQGTGKSSSLKALVGEKWFAEPQAALDNKDFEGSLLGKLIIEFAELNHFKKAENTLIKKKLSCSVDNFRLPWDRRVKDVPRTCIFVGTTNDERYLQDETGGRRFWPVKTTTIDMKYIQDNREQLYAEAVQMHKEGFEYFSVPESAKDEQAARLSVHPWEDIIRAWLDDQPSVQQHRSDEIWKFALDGNFDRFTDSVSKQIAKAMKALGWENKQIRLDGKNNARYWVRPGYTGVELSPEIQSKIDRQMPPRVVKNYAPNKLQQEEY